jgi:cytochrome c553
VLFNEDSLRMGKLLGIAAPHKETLCLKCHATPAVKPEEAVSEGVGCAACHGPGEKWVPVHTLPRWKTLSNREKWEGYGFVPTKNLVARVLNCAGCHVGDADREVNHDLIAAGHPRLAFEYTRFHFDPQYRRHWHEHAPQPDFEIRAWVVGQAATLRAATNLLRARAERAAVDDPNAHWPEFAGLSCHACHRSLDGIRVSGRSRPLGVPGWEVWSNTAAGTAAKLCPEAFPEVSAPGLVEIAALRILMNKPRPNPKAVAIRAARATAELDVWLADLQNAEDRGVGGRLPLDTPRKFAHALADNALNFDRTKLADADRDALTVNFLGAAAMYHAAGGRSRVPGWSAPLRELTSELRLPAARLGATLDRERIRDRFRELLEATAP